MDHHDHVNLLRDGIRHPGGTWADLGSGTGAFTLALADLIGPAGRIYSVDRDAGVLRRQERSMRARFPAVTVHYLAADYCQWLDLPLLDGVVMANSLHFQLDKDVVLQLVLDYLKPDGLLLLVEYNSDRGNPWVPIPPGRRWPAATDSLARGCSPPGPVVSWARSILRLAGSRYLPRTRRPEAPRLHLLPRNKTCR
jgi:ubiquinone/menaquinone biosynthesis C-methylase UbiE